MGTNKWVLSDEEMAEVIRKSELIKPKAKLKLDEFTIRILAPQITRDCENIAKASTIHAMKEVVKWVDREMLIGWYTEESGDRGKVYVIPKDKWQVLKDIIKRLEKRRLKRR